MTASPVRRLMARTGRVLLLGAVAFWWGAVVGPRLFSLAFPALLATDAIPPHLNPDLEGSLANAVSAISLLTAALLAMAMVRQAHHERSYWITTGGWAVLAVTAAYLAWEEVSEFHIASTLALGDEVLGMANSQYLWPVLSSPLIVTFLLAMWAFARKGLPSTSSGREVRALFMLGLAAWLLAVAHEASYPFLFKGRAEMVEVVLEETLEFGGALLIGLGAAIALGSHAVSRPPSGALRGHRLFQPLVGSVAAAAVLGGLVLAFAFRVPVIDARAAYSDTFELSLRDGEAIIQELRMPTYPVGSFRVRLANRDPNGLSGIAAMRITELGTSEPILAEGFVEVPAQDSPVWRDIELIPPLSEAQGRSLAVQLAADIGREARLRIGATQMDHYPDGRLWINGTLTWPDQDLEFVADSTKEPTLIKFQAIWRAFASDWRWPVMLTDFAIALTFITFIPVVLVTAVLARRL